MWSAVHWVVVRERASVAALVMWDGLISTGSHPALRCQACQCCPRPLPWHTRLPTTFTPYRLPGVPGRGRARTVKITQFIKKSSPVGFWNSGLCQFLPATPNTRLRHNRLSSPPTFNNHLHRAEVPRLERGSNPPLTMASRCDSVCPLPPDPSRGVYDDVGPLLTTMKERGGRTQKPGCLFVIFFVLFPLAGGRRRLGSPSMMAGFYGCIGGC